RAPKILARALRLEDRSRRHQQPPQATCRRHVEAAERRARPPVRRGPGVLRPRPRGAGRAGGPGPWGGGRREGGPPPAAPSRRAGGGQGRREEGGQRAEKIALAIVGIAGLEGIVMAIAHEVARGCGTVGLRTTSLRQPTLAPPVMLALAERFAPAFGDAEIELL